MLQRTRSTLQQAATRTTARLRTGASQVRRFGTPPPGGPSAPPLKIPQLLSPVFDLSKLDLVPFRAYPVNDKIPDAPKKKPPSVTPENATKDKSSLVASSSDAAKRSDFSVPKNSVIILHWPRLDCNNKGTGHIALYFPHNGSYLSYYPKLNSPETIVGASRTDVPGFEGTPLIPIRRHADPTRKFKNDVETFGPLNFAFMVPDIIDFSAALYLAYDALNPGHGVPVYQLFDSELGKEDRMQCASVAATILSDSTHPKFEAFGNYIGAQYEPDKLMTAIAQVSKEVEPTNGWSTQEFPFAHLDPSVLGD